MATAKPPGYSYNLEAFTDRTFGNTKLSWTRQLQRLSGEVFPTDYLAKLEWAQKNIDYKGGNPDFAYGVFKEESSHADAIVDVVYQRQAGMGFPRFPGHYPKPSLACSNWSGLI